MMNKPGCKDEMMNNPGCKDDMMNKPGCKDDMILYYIYIINTIKKNKYMNK